MYLRIHNNNRRFLKSFLQKGDLVCDATCGNGHDTLFLAEQVLPGGHVYAIDLQQEALENCQMRLQQAGFHEKIDYIHGDHRHLKELVPPNLKALFFNLGYLPRSDHSIRTQADSSLAALQAGIELLAPGGLISLMIYFDPPHGPKEGAVLLDWARSLASEEFAVLESRLSNMPKDPPLQVFIEKLHRPIKSAQKAPLPH